MKRKMAAVFFQRTIWNLSVFHEFFLGFSQFSRFIYTDSYLEKKLFVFFSSQFLLSIIKIEITKVDFRLNFFFS